MQLCSELPFRLVSAQLGDEREDANETRNPFALFAYTRTNQAWQARCNFLGLSGGSLRYRVTILLSPGEDLDWPARIELPADNPMSADLRLSRRGVDQAT